MASVLFKRALSNGKPKTIAAGIARTGSINSKKFTEYIFQDIVGNSRPLILYEYVVTVLG